jgi:O-phospho-L-seryl-tRNASec:L-selenocysteinyl-tRNA synthase|eukprot:g7511.t1
MHTDKNKKLAEGLVDAAYVRQGIDALNARHNLVTSLLSQRRMPENGWDDASIEYLLSQLALMDSNNFTGNVGVGEREARVYSDLVKRRTFNLGHGIGRSGDVSAVQPKAAGSSTIVKLATGMMLGLIHDSGVLKAKAALIMPCATGMSLVLTMLTLKQTRRPAQAKYVIWNRIDQKSCFKSILTAGFQPIIIENVLEGEELRTNVPAIRKAIESHGADNIVCVLSTTSCFAPRAADDVESISEVCKEYSIGHVINNAYGLQLSKCCHVINQACRRGRVDAFVQSTDKNLMVPVGGAIVAGPDKAFIKAVSENYAGRASMSPILDVFITMLSMGRSGWKKMLKSRKELFTYAQEKLGSAFARFYAPVLKTRGNSVSIAVSLEHVANIHKDQSISYLGSMLFTRGVSGTRVADNSRVKTIGDHKFTCWGQNSNIYPVPYLTVAVSVGTTKRDIDEFIQRLDKALEKFCDQAREKEIKLKKEKEGNVDKEGVVLDGL